jgi:hypothetical protein
MPEYFWVNIEISLLLAGDRKAAYRGGDAGDCHFRGL